MLSNKMSKYKKTLDIIKWAKYLNYKLPNIEAECLVCGNQIYKRSFDQEVKYHGNCRQYRKNMRDRINV